MSKKTWAYTTHVLLLIMEIILLILTSNMLADPFFALIPIQKYDPYILMYCVINLVQAVICVVIIVSLHRSSIRVVLICHWMSAFTLLIDALVIFIFAALMSNAHVTLKEHIWGLYVEKNNRCSVWDEVYLQLNCCPPSFALKACTELLNATHIVCPIDHSNDCYIHLRKWLHTNTERVAFCAFCVIVPLKCFMCCALRKDYEEIETEFMEQQYFAEFRSEIIRHGDGYLESYRSKSNLILNAEPNGKGRTVSQYSPFIRPEVIEEVEHEFTVRGDELRNELHQAMTAHSGDHEEQ